MDAPITNSAVWTSSWVSSLLKFIVLTIILLVALVLMFTFGNLNEIQKNFPRYRCNPLFIPFASYFGYDTKDNFNFCLSTIFDSKAAEIFAPIYQLLFGFVTLTKTIVDVALGIRKLFSNFLLGVNGFILSVRDRIQQLLFNIRMSFMRLQHLMNRVYGTMYAIVWMGTSAVTAGFNLSDNSLVQFLFEFCFDPETPLKLADGSYIPLRDAQLGMKIAAPNCSETEITSLFEFDGSNTPMVNIDGVIMSSEHFIYNAGVGSGGEWIAAKHHPRAVPTLSIPRLICLNVKDHEFIVGNPELRVADYDEHSSQDVITKTQILAESRLNGSVNNQDQHQERSNYDLGIDPDAQVRMADKTWKPLKQIQLGDNVWNGGQVYGIVHESVLHVKTVESIEMSSAQLVFDEKQTIWSRKSESEKENKRVMIQLITQNTAFVIRSPKLHKEVFVRDYREIPDPDMEDAYIVAQISKN